MIESLKKERRLYGKLIVTLESRVKVLRERVKELDEKLEKR